MTACEPLLKPSKPSKLPLHRRSAGHTFKTLETGIKVVLRVLSKNAARAAILGKRRLLDGL